MSSLSSAMRWCVGALIAEALIYILFGGKPFYLNLATIIAIYAVLALGLGVLITASAHAGRGLSSASAVLSAHVDTAFAAGSVLLALCLITTLALILPTELRNTR